MAKLILKWAFALLSFQSLAQAVELQYQAEVTLPFQMKFKNTRVGGLSGLMLDPSNGLFYSVSDDRGTYNEPRIYELKMSLEPFKVEPQNVIFLSVNKTSLAHPTQKAKAQIFSRVFDLEGISLTPWGDFLLINEGDMNRLPRVNPQVFTVKKDGTIQKNFEVPEAFLPEPSGKQKKGVQNNKAFEGAAAHPNGKEWMISTEASLLQDPGNQIRFLQYTMPEAWVLKPGLEFIYPMSQAKPDPNVIAEFQKGVSDLLYLDEHRLLVMERALQIFPAGAVFQIQIFEVDLRNMGSDRILQKKRILDLKDLQGKSGRIENFEGMTLGPKLSDGQRSLILVSDDNFMRDQRTQFLLFSVKE